MSEHEYGVLIERMNGLTTLINAQSTATHELIGEVNKRLDKLNGKVNKHEDQITEALIERAKNREEQKNQANIHYALCPNSPKIRAIEDNMLSAKSIKRWIAASIAITGTLVAIVFSIFKIFGITI